MRKQFSAVITQVGNIFVALSPELDIASHWPSIDETLTNLKEAIELYLEGKDVDIPMEGLRPLITLVEVESSWNFQLFLVGKSWKSWQDLASKQLEGREVTSV